MPRSLALFFALGACLAAPTAALAGTFGSAQMIGTGGDPFDPPPEIGFDNTGGVLVMYEGNKVFVSRKPNLAPSFTQQDLGAGDRASMAVARNGAAVVAWRASSTSVQVAYRGAPGVALVPNQATFTGESGVGNVAAGIDSNGNAFVAWKASSGIRFSTSTGGAFTGAQTATGLGNPTFDGRTGDLQRDTGPRAFRDTPVTSTSNVGDATPYFVLVYRDGSTPVVARRQGTNGPWVATNLPGTAGDIKADADPVTRRLIVGYPGSAGFTAWVGSTNNPAGLGMSRVVSGPAAASANSSVAMRAADTENMAIWQGSDNVLRAAGCGDGYRVQAVRTGTHSSVAGAVTTGSDQIGGVTGALPGGNSDGGLSRPLTGTWAYQGVQTQNSGATGAAGGYFADGLIANVGTDNKVRGYAYTGTPSNTGRRCNPATGTVTQVVCTYRYASEDDLCTATVGAATRVPTGQVEFADARNGSFPDGTRCTLQRTPGSGNVASCAVRYLRPFEVPPARLFPQVTATYLGDADNGPSSGSTQLLGCVLPQNAPFVPRSAGRGPRGRAAAVGTPLTVTEKQRINKRALCESGVPSLAVIAGLAPSPQQATGAALTSIAVGDWNKYLAFQVNIVDPVDRRYRSLVKPKRIRMPRFARKRNATKLQKAWDAYLANEAASISLQRAQMTSIYRAQTAFNDKQFKHARRQMLAVAKFTRRIANLRAKHRGVAKRLARALRRARQDVRLTAKSVRRGKSKLRKRGFSKSASRAIRRIVGGRGLRLLRNQIGRLQPRGAKTTLSALILRVSREDATVAKILRRMAARIRKNPDNVPGVG